MTTPPTPDKAVERLTEPDYFTDPSVKIENIVSRITNEDYPAFRNVRDERDPTRAKYSRATPERIFEAGVRAAVVRYRAQLAALNAEMAANSDAADLTVADLEAKFAAQSRALKEGWLPNILCPTDGVWRCHRLPDGREVVAAFEGRDLGSQVRKWRIKKFAYHNPQRPTGEVFGGIERMTASYDTYVVTDLPEGVYPTHFRPNDTVYGEPTIRRAAQASGGE